MTIVVIHVISAKIEAAEEVIRHAPILPLWEKQFREEAVVRAAYHGTHIEGNMLQKADAKFALLHCVSTYPVAFKDVNLKLIQLLKKKYKV